MAFLRICVIHICFSLIFITLIGVSRGGSITQPPTNTTALTSRNATFTCQVENQEEEEVFFWYKLPALNVPESPLMLSYNDLSRDENKYVVGTDYTMLIVDVALEDEGHYQCSVANDVYRAYLTVIDPPDMKVRLSDGSKTVASGDRVNMTCEASQAYPPVTLRWFKGITEMTESASQTSTGPDTEGYGDTTSTVEVSISKYDYLAYMLCVADTDGYQEVAVKQYDFDFGTASSLRLPVTLLIFAFAVYVNVVIT